jgi:hypothetical protein
MDESDEDDIIARDAAATDSPVLIVAVLPGGNLP